MFDLTLPLWGAAAVFLTGAGIIAFAGVKAAKYADRVADRTGMGEALTGTVLLGFLTALPGLVASIVAAIEGRPVMAISNAIGGIAIQTTALAVADIAYTRANLEHAAASVPNIMQSTMLVMLLMLVLLGISGPAVTVAHVHPATPILIVTASCALFLTFRTRKEPMWNPKETDETVADIPSDEEFRGTLRGIFGRLSLAALATGVSGALVAEASDHIVAETGISEMVIGGLLLAIATSLPELVTSVAAVRRGALTLAVSNVVGGNFFDVLFVAAADIAYLDGSLYHAKGVGSREIFLTSLTVLLNIVLLAGLIYRQKKGPGNIGFESVLMLVLYVSGFLVLSLAM